MNKNDKKVIYILLIIIIIFSSILLYKIEKTPEYDKSVYEQVYREYEQIVNNIDSTESTSKMDYENNNVVYITEGVTEDINIIVGVIDIPKINLKYPIINECTEANLKIAPTKLVGPKPNRIGNFVIVAHNNWNNDFFSNIHKLEKDDVVKLTDSVGRKLIYKVYDKYEIEQDNFSCLNQNTNNKIELTLITCVKYKKNKRMIVKCVAET